MDLKEFIIETISGIVDATDQLQTSYEPTGTIINPPVSNSERDLYEEGSSKHRYRRVEVVEFDVAVSAASETGAGGKVGIKILSIEAGADGNHSRKNEEASRVRFSIPIALKPSSAEAANKEASKKRRRSANEMANNYK
ncbi:trypco2 family protein [Parasulfitobacter algicola]|uniref:Uncharacterized protein n=1 Tax=Parasulfitobacter algicola TaxID=2614809 RepID=A0ABX2IQB6_9RHOB|nr:trypco2 family protein [Sulfitobacter algicola]NSX55053.1 hypothetical protein [Sulfitobacter algicola]